MSAAASPSSVAPILYLGATPVFVDSGTGGVRVDLQDVAAKLTERTRAVVAVHLRGRTGDVVRRIEFVGSLLDERAGRTREDGTATDG